jgi:peroxiredoxin Q/BCP
LNAVIVGISPDSVIAQARFKVKHRLPYTLLSDPDHEAAKAYGAWVEKVNYGKKYMGIERSTFLIDAKGRISHIFRKVKAAGHAAIVGNAMSE